MLLHNQGCRLFQSLHFRKVFQDAQRIFCADSKSEKLGPKLSFGRPSVSRSFEQIQGCICQDVAVTISDAHQS